MNYMVFTQTLFSRLTFFLRYCTFKRFNRKFMGCNRAYNKKIEIMIKSIFDNTLVNTISVFLQEYMKDNNIDVLSADDCASLLAEREYFNKYNWTKTWI